ALEPPGAAGDADHLVAHADAVQRLDRALHAGVVVEPGGDYLHGVSPLTSTTYAVASPPRPQAEFGKVCFPRLSFRCSAATHRRRAAGKKGSRRASGPPDLPAGSCPGPTASGPPAG